MLHFRDSLPKVIGPTYGEALLHVDIEDYHTMAVPNSFVYLPGCLSVIMAKKAPREIWSNPALDTASKA